MHFILFNLLLLALFLLEQISLSLLLAELDFLISFIDFLLISRLGEDGSLLGGQSGALFVDSWFVGWCLGRNLLVRLANITFPVFHSLKTLRIISLCHGARRTCLLCHHRCRPILVKQGAGGRLVRCQSHPILEQALLLWLLCLLGSPSLRFLSTGRGQLLILILCLGGRLHLLLLISIQG